MILTSQKRMNLRYKITTFFLVCILFAVPFVSLAQTASKGLSLSVTPTLFQMSAVPEQSWNSGVKVINNNPFELTVYAQVVNFAPQGETGEGKFLPIFEKSTEGTTLAEWISLSSEAIVIAPEQSVTIPFTVSVPKDAAPGGHFAAILVGTKPPESAGVIKISTSQIVTSLFFVRVAGDVQEQGTIREFRTTRSFVDVPKADFQVRFENKGNVHLQPQGEIIITNMWGKERGTIPINHQTHFGNVLPQSIRKFEFSWKGEQSFSDIGRYTAQLTLVYGTEGRKFETAKTYFYVIPVKATLIIISLLVAFILLVRWSVNAYIRKMLALSGIEPYERTRFTSRSMQHEGDVRIQRRPSVKAPLLSGISDFKMRLINADALVTKTEALILFIKAYRVFFLSVLGILSLVILISLFVFTAQKEQRDYEVVIANPDTSVTLSSEDIIYAEKNNDQIPNDNQSQTFTFIVKNSSDVPGAAAKLQPLLESYGYTVSDLQSDFTKVKDRSVIVYSQELQESALDLSKKLGGLLLSSDMSTTTSEATLTLYVGNDIAHKQ